MDCKWITVSEITSKKNIYFRARKSFTPEKIDNDTPKNLYIATESYYALWVNGQFIGRGPARGNRNVNYFDIYDITTFLHKGENCIAVLVQSMNIPNFNSSPSAAALALEVEGVCKSDKSWEVLYNSEWREDVEFYTKQTGFCEDRDIRKEPQGWQIGVDNNSWQKAEELGSTNENTFGKKLQQRDIPFLKETIHYPAEIYRTALIETDKKINDKNIAEAIDTNRHFEINGELQQICQPLLTNGEHEVLINPVKNSDGVSLTFNFNKELIGFLEIEASCPEGTIFEICHDEEPFEGRLISQRCSYNFADRYTAKEGKQVIGNFLHERAFRYVEIVIRNFKKPVTIHSLKMRDRRYPFPPKGEFFSNDQMLNRMWDVCLETVSSCTTDVFTDCPWRERAFWVNDMMVQGLVSMQAFGDYRLNRHALSFALSNRREDRWLPSICPDAGDKRNILLQTNFFITMELEDYLMYSGDFETVKNLLPDALDILDLVHKNEDSNHLFTPDAEMWNFIDWGYNGQQIKHDGKNSSTLNWLYCAAMKSAIRLLKLTEINTSKIGELEKRATNTANGINKVFWQEDKQLYREFDKPLNGKEHYSKLSHAFALMSGMLDTDKHKACLTALLNDDIIIPDLFMQHFVLNELRKNRLYAESLNYIRKYWGRIINTGSPTLHEFGLCSIAFTKRNHEAAQSLCHGFCSTPAHYFQSAILGVKPLEPGFKIFEVAPVAHDLNFAKGKIPTPKGTISVNWQKEDGKLTLELTIPYGLKAITPVGEFSSGKHCITL